MTDDRSERLRRVRALQDEDCDNLRAALLRGAPGAARRGEGTTAEGAASSTLASPGYGHHTTEPDQVRAGLDTLRGHIDEALTASFDRDHAAVRRHLRCARAVHKSLCELLGKGE